MHYRPKRRLSHLYSTSKSTLTFDELARLGHHWNAGGCVVSVHDSAIADAWITEHYDDEILVLLRETNIGGPIASMLSFGSVALAIFGKMSPSLVGKANMLAECSGFPVVVRPLEDDPSPRFR